MSISLSDLPDVLTPAELAHLARKGRNWPYGEIAAGRIAAVRLGRRSIRISKREAARVLGLDQDQAAAPDARGD